ncbi:MAG: NnrU family protein [Myxococcales bacterium]|nr:NnrU family protein [Myxococcales bacterium]
MLLSASALFVALHSLISGTPLRARLVRALGPRAYQGAFSLASLAALGFIVFGYRRAFAFDNVFYWHFGTPPAALSVPVMLTALFFVVAGLSSPNPTSVGQEKLLASAPEPRGIQRVTRHPFLWGVIVWSSFHLTVNGDRASLALFATFLVVSLVGTFSIDQKRAQDLGETWSSYVAQSSNLPFAAIATGKNRFVFSEIGLGRVLATLLVFAAIVSIHPWLFGAYPLPGMDD